MIAPHVDRETVCDCERCERLRSASEWFPEPVSGVYLTGDDAELAYFACKWAAGSAVESAPFKLLADRFLAASARARKQARA